ncbi:MAG: hypothetical protein IT454_18910 [Planctomycetes bacterium]|nr:hypothetical protein [Planctomycetota bacterium]
MAQSRHTSLSLRTQLSGLAGAVNSSDPSDFFSVARVVQQLSLVRGLIEKEQVTELVPLCTAAQRLAELLNQDGQIGATDARAVIDQIVVGMCEQLGIERQAPAPSAAPEVGAQAPVAKPEVGAKEPPPALGKTATGPSLKLVSNRKLGDLMVQLSMLTPTQVEQALGHQRMTGCRFGEALVQMRILPKDAVESALRIQSARKAQGDGWGAGR